VAAVGAGPDLGDVAEPHEPLGYLLHAARPAVHLVDQRLARAGGAVRAALRWQDGTGGSALIHESVCAAAGVSLDDLVARIHAHPSERSFLTGFAPMLAALAETDPVAMRIAVQAAEHLAALAAAVRRGLGELPVAGTGGVFGSPVIWDRFVSLTGAVRPQASPAVGAALLAAGLT